LSLTKIWFLIFLSIKFNSYRYIAEEDIGTGAGLFKVEKLGEEYFTFFVDCDEPKACSIILRGASRDVLNEVGQLYKLNPA
jgi:chaperonin GroEL (HSP60 family)